MKKIIFCVVFLFVLSGCSFGSPTGCVYDPEELMMNMDDYLWFDFALYNEFEKFSAFTDEDFKKISNENPLVFAPVGTVFAKCQEIHVYLTNRFKNYKCDSELNEKFDIYLKTLDENYKANEALYNSLTKNSIDAKVFSSNMLELKKVRDRFFIVNNDVLKEVIKQNFNIGLYNYY